MKASSRAITKSGWILAFSLFLTALLVPARSYTQTETRNVSFIVSGNASVASSRIADDASTGFGGVAGVVLIPWRNSAPEISIRLSGAFDAFDANSDRLSDFEFIRTGIDLRFVFSQLDEKPVYLLLGSGYTRVSIDTPLFSGRTTRIRDNAAYISPGIGIMLTDSASPLFFLEARFTNIDGKSAGDFQFWSLSVGLSL